jgi:hypothetical protein
MDWSNPRSVETKIKRLTREIGQIDECFYRPDKEDRVAYAGMLERKRDDVVRSAVLQMHTAIEDLLTQSILCRVLQAPGGAPEESAAKRQWRFVRCCMGRAVSALRRGSTSQLF